MKIEKPLFRELTLKRGDIDEDTRSLSLAFSSEEPVMRWFGKEILDHSAAAVNLGRLQSGGAVLWGHDPDQLIGVVESASVDDDRRGRAVVRFAETPDAEIVWQKVKQGIARQVSVGYSIDKIEKESEDDTGPTYRATRWTPYEVSIVSVPADNTVGVGRNQQFEDSEMKPEDKNPAEQPAVEERAVDAGEIAKQVADELRADAARRADAEKQRCDAIRQLGTDHQRETLAIEAIESGKTVEEFRDMILEASKSKPIPEQKREPRIEMNYRHGKLRAFDTSPEGLEKAYRTGQWAKAVLFGDKDAKRWCDNYGVRVMTGTSASTSSLVPEEMIQPIIDLRESYGVARQECYVQPMQSDTASVPRRKSGVTAYFAGREEATTASDAAFDDINLVAREVSALTRISKQYAADAVIDLGDHMANEMAYAFAVKEDECLFNGDGTSTYGGIVGIRTKLLGTAGAVDGASGIDLFSEVTNTDLTNVEGALPDYPGIMPKWYVSRKGNALMFSRLAAAAGGNTKATMAGGLPQMWNGDPVVLSQAMPKVITDLSDVVMAVYGDLTMGVTFGDRMGFEVQVLTERYAEYRQIGVIATERFDIVVHGCGDATDAGPIVGLVGE